MLSFKKLALAQQFKYLRNYSQCLFKFRSSNCNVLVGNISHFTVNIQCPCYDIHAYECPDVKPFAFLTSSSLDRDSCSPSKSGYLPREQPSVHIQYETDEPQNRSGRFRGEKNQNLPKFELAFLGISPRILVIIQTTLRRLLSPSFAMQIQG